MPVTSQPDVYRAVLESLPHGVYLVNRERKVLLWNDGAERITGYLRHEVIGRSCLDCLLLYCDENDVLLCGAECPLARSMRDARPWEADVFLRHKDGMRVPVHVHVAPVRDPDGNVIGVATSFDERVLLPDWEAYARSRAVQDHIDGVTGIPDRESALRHLAASIEDFHEDQIPFGVLTIALKGLEELGQSHGIKAAEAMLSLVARTIVKNLHPRDMVGRWAGDRLVVVLANCPASALSRVAGMLARIIAVTALPWWGDRISVKAAIGGTAGRPDDTTESLTGRAEQALERAGGDDPVFIL